MFQQNKQGMKAERNIKTSSTSSLNRHARSYLLNNCISRKMFPVAVFGFTGYVNGFPVEDAYLYREQGEWRISQFYIPEQQRILVNGKLLVTSLGGEFAGFAMLKANI